MRIFLTCFLLLAANVCAAGILYVPSEEYPSIQQAINLAINGDTIIVAPGRYFENINFLGKAITVRSAEPNNPDIVAATIIDGNRPANINSASVVTFKTGETSASIIEGFTITGGTGSWLQIYWEFKGTVWNRCGGGIVCSNYSSPTIRKNIITRNLAGEGGGIYCYDHSNAAITDNTISDNNAIINHGFPDPDPNDPNVYDDGGGGGIYIYYQSNPLVEQNLITQNSSSNGAGISVYYSSNPTIRNNIITKNLLGAGIRISGLAPVITNNTISFNTYNGIQYESGASPIITNNIITSNLSGKGINALGTAGTIKYNDVWGHSGGNYSSTVGDLTGINGNISVNPKFINPNGNDFHLDRNSTCINAADPNSSTDCNDFDGQSRKMGQFVDIGADEAKPVWNITKSKQYDTIQAAVNDANNGQTIVLTVGTYKGTGNKNVDFMAKAITIQSAEPNDTAFVQSTIIDSENNGRGFWLHRGEGPNSIIHGISIINGGNVFEGGGINCGDAIYGVGSSPTIRNCIFKYNRPIDHGGAIYCGYGSNAIISDCLFEQNSFNPVGYGGGIYCYKSSPVITNCIFINNKAIGPARHGGAICCWGINGVGSNAIVANCLIIGNSADHRGGGLYAYWSSPTFVNCTVIGNKALEGGGIGSFRQSNPLVVNCIVRNNIAPDGNQLALINTLRVWPWQEITKMTVKNSNIQGGQAGVWVDPNMILYWQSGNIDTEPNFVDLGHWDDANTPLDPNDDFYVVGNYHLLPGSVCINKGNNASVPAQSITDIDSEQRIFNGTVDMGADEFVTNAADFNNDGIVDFADVLVYSQYWLSEVEGLPADFVDDNFIDFADFAVFAENWFWTAAWR